MSSEAFAIRLEAFEGPMDLLLHLIEKNKVDIYDIPIVTITDQYIAYIDAMRVKDMDIMSEFLLMAATLLAIKSKMLLPALRNPGDEEAEDPRMELIERLVEYKAYKEISGQLRDMQVDAAHMVFKPRTLPPEVEKYEEPVDIEKLLDGLTLQRLNAVFNDVLKRQRMRKDPVRSSFGEIKKEEISLEECMSRIMDRASVVGRFTFVSLFDRVRTRMEIIVTFLAVLELMKAGRLYIVQENIYDDIIIENRAA